MANGDFSNKKVVFGVPCKITPNVVLRVMLVSGIEALAVQVLYKSSIELNRTGILEFSTEPPFCQTVCGTKLSVVSLPDLLMIEPNQTTIL